MARGIATQLHGGQDSALYRFAGTGSLDDERLDAELYELYQSRDPRILEWASVLGTYALHREHRGPVDGWAELWPGQPANGTDDVADHVDPAPEPPSNDAADVRADLMRRINAAGVTTLGRIATIVTGEGSFGRDADQDGWREADVYPWTDAADWYADGGPDELADPEAGSLAAAQVEELFARLPDAEVGSCEAMGWGGLLRHADRPGGVILGANQYGRRWGWATDSDIELRRRWRQLAQEQAAFRNASWSPKGDGSDNPAIWVGSLADYAAGYLHGAWLDATTEPDELVAAVQFLLDNAHEPDAEEHAVMDYDGFGAELSRALGEYPSLETVVRVARGIAEYGGAFAAWAAYVGPEHHEQLDRFEDHYRGEWADMVTYVRDVLDSIGLYDALDEALRGIPEDLRRYIDIDVEALARDWAIEMHVVENPDGGVWLFDMRA